MQKIASKLLLQMRGRSKVGTKPILSIAAIEKVVLKRIKQKSQSIKQLQHKKVTRLTVSPPVAQPMREQGSFDYLDRQKQLSDYTKRYIDKVDKSEQKISVHTLEASQLNLSREDSLKIQDLKPLRAKCYSSLEYKNSRERKTPGVFERYSSTAQEAVAAKGRDRLRKTFVVRRRQKSRIASKKLHAPNES